MTHGTHTSRDFESELRELRAHALAMGARCERGLQLALKAFWEGSAEVAAEVEELDRHIDRDEMDIDALVLRILALRQPVAFDLRLLATTLKLNTVAEGVEHADQRAQLLALGCHYGQGFLFAKPIDAEAIGALLQADAHASRNA